MSADIIFSTTMKSTSYNNNQKTTPIKESSKIPIPSSPNNIVLRRANSLRVTKADRKNYESYNNNNNDIELYCRDGENSYVTNQNYNSSLRTQQSVATRNVAAAAATDDKWRRNLSKHGVQAQPATYSAMPSSNRLQTFETSSPNTNNVGAAATLKKSPAPRIRSLSLSLSTNSQRLSSPRSPSSSAHHLQQPPKTPPTTPDLITKHLSVNNLLDRNCWDSAASLTSVTSTTSSCDHASVARNGTTFSGRSMKYVFHCNQHSGATGEDYLTPTQRVHRQVRKLRTLLEQAKNDLDEKDSDILKLTKEVVELRLYKAALNSPEDKSNSSGDDDTTTTITTVKENTNNTDDDDDDDNGENESSDNKDNMIMIGRTDDNNIMTSSCTTDSGHFDDFERSVTLPSAPSLTTATTSRETADKSTITTDCATVLIDNKLECDRLISEYEQRLQELIKIHEDNSCQLKQKHNDKVEELLQQIAEINARYWQLMPELDLAKEKIKELELQLENACQKLEQQQQQKQQQLESENTTEEPQKELDGLKQESQSKIMDIATRQYPSRISVPELLQELQVTKNELEKIKDIEYASTSNSLQSLLSAKEALSLWVLGARKAMYRQLIEAKNKSKIDPEVTLQFLKSAVYYFLTDKENSQGHLKAIQSILGFTANEISNIDKARLL